MRRSTLIVTSGPEKSAPAARRGEDGSDTERTNSILIAFGDEAGP